MYFVQVGNEWSFSKNPRKWGNGHHQHSKWETAAFVSFLELSKQKQQSRSFFFFFFIWLKQKSHKMPWSFLDLQYWNKLYHKTQYPQTVCVSTDVYIFPSLFYDKGSVCTLYQKCCKGSEDPILYLKKKMRWSGSPLSSSPSFRHSDHAFFFF